MISHVLDTDTLTLFQHGHPSVSPRCAAMPAGSLAVSVLSIEEQFLGWYTAARQAKRDDEVARAYDNMAAFTNFIKQLPVLPFSLPAILRYRQLKASKVKVSKKDLCIAAIAVEFNVTVVTRNVSDFSRVPGLIIEDWSK